MPLTQTIANLLIHEACFLQNNENLSLVSFVAFYLALVIKQPNFRIPNPQYLQRNFCFDFFNDSDALSFYVTKTVLVGPKWFWSDQIDLDLNIMISS